MGFADRVINLTRTEVVNEASPHVSLGRGVSQAKQLFDKTSVSFAAPGMAKIQELPHREIAGMRCHKVEKLRFGLRIAESTEVDELGFVNAHGYRLKIAALNSRSSRIRRSRSVSPRRA